MVPCYLVNVCFLWYRTCSICYLFPRKYSKIIADKSHFTGWLRGTSCKLNVNILDSNAEVSIDVVWRFMCRHGFSLKGKGRGKSGWDLWGLPALLKLYANGNMST